MVIKQNLKFSKKIFSFKKFQICFESLKIEKKNTITKQNSIFGISSLKLFPLKKKKKKKLSNIFLSLLNGFPYLKL